MDPNAALANLREAIRVWDAASPDDTDPSTESSYAADAIEAARDLDEWLSKGGFLPEAWAPAPEQPAPVAPGSLCWYGRAADGGSDGTVEHHATCDEHPAGTITDVRTGRVIGKKEI